MSVLPVNTNPFIIEHLAFKQQEKEIMAASHLLEIEGIFAESKLDERVFDSVRIFCSEHRIKFTLRVFNSPAFEQDRDVLVKLPAFHIYYEDMYEKSFYPGESPAIQVQELLHEINPKKSQDKKENIWWFPKLTWKWPRKSRVASSEMFSNVPS